jgi:hypothetical protein
VRIGAAAQQGGARRQRAGVAVAARALGCADGVAAEPVLTLNLSSSAYLGSFPWAERLLKKASSSSPSSSSLAAALPLRRFLPLEPNSSASASAYASCAQSQM